jgi:hypothetical protein
MALPTEILPVLQITLPLLGGMWLASHSQNKRLDDIVARLLAIENQLKDINTTLRSHAEKLARFEERLPGPKLVSK